MSDPIIPPMMRNARGAAAARLLWGLLVLVLVAVVGAWAGSRWLWPQLVTQAPAATELPTYGPVADFQLTDQDGRPFGSADLKGKVWIADFVFTRCSGPCPVLTNNLAGLIDSLGAGFPAHYVSFTVDPEYDTPAVFKEYGLGFHADFSRWHFLSGPRPSISDLSVNSFHMAMGDPEITQLARPAADARHDGAAEGRVADMDSANAAPEDPAEALNIPHSIRLVLVDRHGQIRGYYDGTDLEAVARLAQEVRQIVKERA